MFPSMEISNKSQCYMYWLDSHLVLIIASLHSTCSLVSHNLTLMLILGQEVYYGKGELKQTDGGKIKGRRTTS